MLLPFTEVISLKDPDDKDKPTEVIEKPCFVNSEGIVAVNTSKMRKSGAVIIGSLSEIDVSFIQLTTGRGVYVKETLDEIAKAVAAVPAKA